MSTTLLTAGALPSRAGVAGTYVDVSVDVGVCVGTDVGPSFGVQLFPLPRSLLHILKSILRSEMDESISLCQDKYVQA